MKLSPERIRARTCYKHPAGALGRGLLAFMQARGYCFAGAGDRRLAVTPKGAAFLSAALGIDWAAGRRA